jgi:predicted CxxxxCH...CXXCH cytochrome family protein
LSANESRPGRPLPRTASSARRSALPLVLALAAAGCSAREVPAAGDPCWRCHGGEAGNAAPPRSTRGVSSAGDPRVGAHQAHLRGGELAGPVACAECHVVPVPGGDHVDGDATPVFGALASAGERSRPPSFERATGTCSDVYCHGATLGAGGGLTAPVWTATDGAARACGACHGAPPPDPHPQLAACNGCHRGTVDEHGAIVRGGHHLDGAVQLEGDCGACHGLPPATGAHAAHVGVALSPAIDSYGDLRILADAPGPDTGGYAFGCGHCHPLDAARHGTGEVDLSPPPTATGTLKDRNAPAASYDPATGTCSGVYCHSGGKGIAVLLRSAPGVIEAVGPFRTTPAWTSGTSPGCGGCHGNPPRYESGGAGAEDANTHLVLDADGWETGHFGGLPGPWHTSKHGGGDYGPPQRASPITCQSCHAETADPASTGPSGFYWLDTTGDYRIPGGALGYACGACHGQGDPAAPAGGGRVLPLRHVNGSIDVAFDPRTALPPYAALPVAPFTPSRPIFVTDAGISFIPADAIREPDPVPPPPPGGWPYVAATLSMHLGSAGWDPATKTCSNVSCHLAQTSVRWGGPTGWSACGECHPY